MRHEILKIEPVQDFYLRSKDENEPTGFFVEKIYFLIFYKEITGDAEVDEAAYIQTYPVTNFDLDQAFIELEARPGYDGTGVIIHKNEVDKYIKNDSL